MAVWHHADGWLLHVQTSPKSHSGLRRVVPHHGPILCLMRVYESDVRGPVRCVTHPLSHILCRMLFPVLYIVV
jgi:hypothetical protein